jgi:hypothetical protein
LKLPKRGGWRRERRVLEAALIRFRPIITTTLAALLGVAIVGGLCVSQLPTLSITRVVYHYLDEIDSALAGRRNVAARQTAEPAPEPLPAPDSMAMRPSERGADYQEIIKGAVIIAAIITDQYRQRKRRKA